VIPHSRRQIQKPETRSLIDSTDFVHADLSILGKTKTFSALSQCFISISDGSAEGKIKVQKTQASKAAQILIFPLSVKEYRTLNVQILQSV